MNSFSTSMDQDYNSPYLSGKKPQGKGKRQGTSPVQKKKGKRGTSPVQKKKGTNSVRQSTSLSPSPDSQKGSQKVSQKGSGTVPKKPEEKESKEARVLRVSAKLKGPAKEWYLLEQNVDKESEEEIKKKIKDFKANNKEFFKRVVQKLKKKEKQRRANIKDNRKPVEKRTLRRYIREYVKLYLGETYHIKKSAAENVSSAIKNLARDIINQSRLLCVDTKQSTFTELTLKSSLALTIPQDVGKYFLATLPIIYQKEQAAMNSKNENSGKSKKGKPFPKKRELTIEEMKDIHDKKVANAKAKRKSESQRGHELLDIVQKLSKEEK